MRKKISKDILNLDYTFYAWLYERLKAYRKAANGLVDLNYHKFEYNGEKYTQAQMIDMMIKRLEFFFDPKFDDWNCDDVGYVLEAARIWAIVLPYMWL